MSEEQSWTPTPEVVGVQITSRCQLRCRHCFMRSGPESRQELPLSPLEALLDEMVTWGVRRIRLSGGEPTLHSRFEEVVEACQKRDIGIALNSHGVYSQRRLAYLLKAPIELFLISIDGMHEIHDEVRGNNTFARAVRSCRRLRQAEQSVTVAFHVGAWNYQDVEAVALLAAEMGAGFKLSPIRPVGRAAEAPALPLVDPAALRECVRRVTELRRRYPRLQIQTDFDLLDHSSRGFPAGSGPPSCRAGRSMINVNYDGEIYPCAFFITPERELSAGNLASGPVLDVWHRSAVFEAFRRHTKPRRCQGCRHYRSGCAGGCPALAYASTGHLDAPDPTCFALLSEDKPGGQT